MENQLLKDPDIFPDAEVIEQALGDCYMLYKSLKEVVQGPEFNLQYQWNYYKDGKSWLCKVVNRKKTIFWISVWDGYFCVTFYFSEKNADDINNSGFSTDVVEDFRNQKAVGKFRPLIVKVTDEKKLNDIVKIASYKIKQK